MADAAVGDSVIAIRRLNLDNDSNDASRNNRNILAKTVRKNHRARDITHDFSEACKELKTGQLVQHDSFTLWGSVQAIEIMDPKMDSGYVAPGERFDSDFDVAQNLLPEELLYIMDRTMRLETAWMRGFALFQTIFTSNHIWHLLNHERPPSTVSFPKRTQQVELSGSDKWLHLVLLAYCVSTIIQCDMILELVTSQQYFEEEDLNTQLYTVRLLNDISDEQGLDLLDQAIAWVASRGDERGDELTPVEEAILDRLELRRGSQVRMLLSSQVFDVDGLLDRVDAVEASADLAKDIPAAFNDKQHRKISTATPVRGLAIISLAEACTDVRHLFETIEVQNRFMLENAPWQNPPSLRLLLWTLASRTPRPPVVARAALQNHLFAQGGPLDGPENIHDYMLAELAELCFPDDALTDGTFFREDFAPGSAGMRIRQRLDEWVRAAQTPSLDILRTLCQNHCRVRRGLVNATRALASLSTTFAPSTPPAQTTPLAAQRDPLALLNTTLSNAASLRHWHTAAQTAQLALAHDLHAPHELPAAYARLAAHTDRQVALLESHLALLEQSQSPSPSPSPPAQPPPLPFRPPSAPARTAKSRALAARIAHASALGAAARAFALVHAALLQARLLEGPPPRSLTTPALLAEVRARDVAGEPDADVVERLVGEDGASVLELLKRADACLHAARSAWSASLRARDRDGGGDGDGRAAADPASAALGSARGLEGLWAAQVVRDVRAVVEMQVAVAALRRGGVEAGGGKAGERVRVRVPALEERASAEWVVPVVAVTS